MNNVYIVDKYDLSIKDIIPCSAYEIDVNLDCTGKSSLTLPWKPNYSKNDYIIFKGDFEYKGIIDVAENNENSNVTTVSCKQIECMFDSEIELTNPELISSSGIEDFIKNQIEDNFTNSGDKLGDKTYVTVTAETHTKNLARPDSENGIYNLKTYIGNVKQYYGIFMEFTFSNGNLGINIYKKEQIDLHIDTSLPLISGLQEKYETNVLAKLKVIWMDTVNMVKTYRYYYLLNNRTITTDSTNTNRAAGDYKTIYIEAETQSEVDSKAYNEFTSNSYNHSVLCNIMRNNKLYDENELYIGHKCTIKTKRHGIKSSIIYSLQYSSSSNGIIGIKFGNLKISLIEKLRG